MTPTQYERMPHYTRIGTFIINLQQNFCDAGCKVVFDEDCCKVYHKGVLVLHGGRDKLTGMWKLPVNPKPESSQLLKISISYQVPRRIKFLLNNLYTLPYKQQQLKFMHQSFFRAPHQTIIDAANNKQLDTIPLLDKLNCCCSCCCLKTSHLARTPYNGKEQGGKATFPRTPRGSTPHLCGQQQ